MTNIVKQEFAVEGMHCGGCVRSVTGAITRLSGVKSADVSLDKMIAVVDYDRDVVAAAAIVEAIKAAGFEANAR